MKSKVGLVLANIARFLTGKFVFNKRLPASFGGAKIRVTSRSDIRLLKPGFNSSSGDLLQVAKTYIRPDYCVWDIGSNLGIFSVCAAWFAGPKGKIFSVEADPYYAELQFSTSKRLPQGYSSITTLCAAIADTNRLLELHIPQRGHSRTHLGIIQRNKAGEIATTKQVVCVTADFLLKHWTPPDFVKVNIEGAEMLFMEGAYNLFEEVRPFMYIEIDEANRQLATEKFNLWNYRLFALSPEGKELPIDTCEYNTIAKPKEKC
jgi:FkbM family methyltransferase